MKVAYLITKAEHGGAQSHVLETMRGMRSKCDVVLAAGEHGWLTKQAESLGIPVQVIPDLVQPISPVRDVRAVFQVKAWLRSERPTLVHLHSSKAGLVGRIAARVCGVPAVFTAHGWAFTEGVGAFRKCISVPSEWISARLGGEIVCVSDYDRNLALRYRIAPALRLHTVHNGIEPSGKMHASPKSEAKLCMVARFARQKRHDLLLIALAGLTDLHWTLDLVGDGPLIDDIKALASELGILDRVRFLGSRSDVDKILFDSDIFILSSAWEGFPVSILEAMRVALPVIASNVGGVGEAIVNGESGMLVERGDVDALRLAVRELITKPDMRLELGRAGKTRFEKNFTSERMLRGLFDVYSKATKLVHA